MSIATEITRIQNAKTALKTAINAKGGSLTTETIDEFATELTSIPTVTEPAPTVSINSETGLVTGSYTPASGFVTDTTAKSGTLQLTVQSAQTITPTTTDQTIASGKYLTGTQTIKGDENLIAANIAKDVKIFNVTGTHQGGTDVSATTATNHDVLSGKYFYTAAGVKTEGSIVTVSSQPDPTVSINAGTGLVTASYTAEAGFTEDNTTHSGTLQISSDNVPTLLASNIKKDVELLGVTGTYEGSGGSSITEEDYLESLFILN